MKRKLLIIAVMFVSAGGFMLLQHIKSANAASTITVNSIADTSADDGVCTLREAITAANSDTASGVAVGECAAGSGAGDIINFSIAGATPHTITPTSELPALTTTMTINGCSEPDATANTAVAPNPFNGTLVVQLVGTSAGVASDGLQVNSGTATIRCLVINQFTVNGIYLNGGTNHVIAGNYIGTSTSGATDLGNTEDGVQVSNSSDGTRIGGTAAADRNIVSGNNDQGISIDNSDSVSVLGNYVGITATGTGDLGNTNNGIALFPTADNAIIGGTASGSTNVISGNNTSSGAGALNVEGTGHNIQGNYIGLSHTGVAEIPNSGVGIFVGGSSVTIGGTAAGARNYIAGNDSQGLDISGDSNTIVGNYFGLGTDSATILQNGNNTTLSNTGLSSGADNNVFGGVTSAHRNYFIGPSSSGMVMAATSGVITGTSIKGNYFGVLPDGTTTASSGAAQGAITIIGIANNNIIGGTETGAGNLIRSNGAGIIAIGGIGGVLNCQNDSFLGNSIYDNSGGPITSLGIDLLSTPDFVTFSNVGVNPNDSGDPDTACNNYMNYPVLSSLSSTNGQATVTYSLDINDTEVGATGYRVEFFANDAADSSGYGEGQTFIGSDTIAGDVTNRSVTFALPTGVSGSKYITAITTMTDASGDGFGHSSEFSAVLLGTLVAPQTPGAGAGSLADTGESQTRSILLGLILVSVPLGLFSLNRWRESHSGR